MLKSYLLSVISIIFLLNSCGHSRTKKVNDFVTYLELRQKLIEMPHAKKDSLLFGFNFGMTKNQIIERSRILSKNKLKLNNLENELVIEDFTVFPIKLSLSFSFHEGFMQKFTIDYTSIYAEDSLKNILWDFAIYFYGEPDLMYTDKKYGRIESNWVTEKQHIYFQSGFGLNKLIIENPNNMYSTDLNMIKEINNKKIIENNLYNGSVSQVKEYLQDNLNDPSSYESISWSPVVETSDGYTVRHKYRAKNTQGVLIIKEQIFYLNKQGEVIRINTY
jgi:hypothetical protein